jgi:hypothetical protein
MNREEKLHIARLAYQDISAAISKFESQEDFDFCAHWDECISVDDEMFYGRELKKSISDDVAGSTKG